jgi:hypothetical protein
MTTHDEAGSEAADAATAQDEAGIRPAEARTARQNSERSDTDRAAEIVAGMGDSTLLRSAAAVIVGFVVLTFGGILQNVALVRLGMGPESPDAARALYAGLAIRGLIAIAAGYLTAKAAPKSPFLHAAVLAGIVGFLSLSAIAGLRAGGGLQDPTWYPTAVLFIGSIGVLVGGAAKARRGSPALGRSPRGSPGSRHGGD